MNLPSEPLNSKIQQRGWIPLGLIGEGGGAQVYLCAKAQVIKSIETLMSGRGIVVVPNVTTSVAGDILKTLSDGLTRQKDALAALKIPKRIGDLTTLKRLKREVEAMKAVQHASFIRLFGKDENDPPEWFVMEWHPNGDLSKSIHQYKGRVVKTLQAVLPIVEAVADLHENGFIHRDIKPTNIFVADPGHLVLGDLGIAFPTEESDRLTELGTTLISRDWVPDWARFTDEPPERKVDVFMLAKVIYFMVTGGQNVLATRLDEEKFDLRYRLKDIEGAADLQEVLLESITIKESQCKFGNARELLIRLKEVLNQLTGTRSGYLLFSFLSVHSSTHVVARKTFNPEDRRYPSLYSLQIFLPNKCNSFHARVRLIGPPDKMHYRFFLQIDQLPTFPSEGYPINAMLDPDRGTWVSEILISLTVPLSRGWHDLNAAVTSGSDGCFVTGFMLYGD